MRPSRSTTGTRRTGAPRAASSTIISPAFLASLRTNDSADWMAVRTADIVKRFKSAYKAIPAYRRFVGRRKVDVASMRGSADDVKRIPVMSKKNYLRANPWKALFARITLERKPIVLTATSGSTGEPFYIPREEDVHEVATFFHKLFLERSGLDMKKPTLVMVCFGMGVWIGGLLTYEAFRRISERSTPLTIITPGVSKKEIFETLARVGPAYEQLVLCGYPPFVKDLVDDAEQHDIDWKRWDVRIVCAAEAFSEHFREYLMQKTGMKDPYRSVMNIYGSAELGTMAAETPLAILLRRLALKHEALYHNLFSEAHRLPTLVQFVPGFTSFEAGKNGAVYATGGNALPLVRYEIGDQGGVFSYDEAVARCEAAGIDLEAEIKEAGIKDTIHELPFVYVYERTDLSTKLYGAIIFPEHVKIGLAKPELERHITGRFTMTTEHDEDHNEYLELNVELRNGSSGDDTLKTVIIMNVMKSLAASSDEYRYLAGSIREKVTPRVILWPYEDPKYFKPGIKQKWVIKAKR